jgi:hypothetical protein
VFRGVLCANKLGKPGEGLGDWSEAERQKAGTHTTRGGAGARPPPVWGQLGEAVECGVFSASAPLGEEHHTLSRGLGASPERTVEVLTSALQKGPSPPVRPFLG